MPPPQPIFPNTQSVPPQLIPPSPMPNRRLNRPFRVPPPPPPPPIIHPPPNIIRPSNRSNNNLNQPPFRENIQTLNTFLLRQPMERNIFS